MAGDAATLSSAFECDFTRPLPPALAAGLGAPAYPATARQSGRDGLMALLVPPGQPPRAAALASETGTEVAGVLMPLAHGRLPVPGRQMEYAVITAAPPGPSLAAALLQAPPGGRRPTEADLLETVLKPAAAALARLHGRGLTHRAIRPDNLFLARGEGGRAAVALGPAWTTPPASLQPPACEPPYSAMCLPAGRGEGRAADDIYALGVTLLAVALGRLPLADLPGAEVARRTLALGSYAALLGEDRLPSTLADLLRGMLADDPDHRPSALLLSDPMAARGRRLAARPQRRATRPLLVGQEMPTDPRSLALALAGHHGAPMLLQSGAVETWVRRDLGDAGLAKSIEEVVRAQRPAGAAGQEDNDPGLVTRAIAVLDPLAPLCWEGLAWWPDGLGAALATAPPEDAQRMERAVRAEASVAWAALREERVDAAKLISAARYERAQLTLPGVAGGRVRLAYALNPLLPCAHPALAGQCVCRLQDVLPALEGLAARAEARQGLPLDAGLFAFLAARAEQSGGGSMTVMLDRPSRTAEPVLLQLRVLAALQGRTLGGPVPALAGWLADHAAPLLEQRRNVAGRRAAEERLRALAQAGLFAPMLEMLEDEAAAAADARGAEAAAAELARLDAVLAGISDGGRARADYADRLGQELAVGAGMTALAAALALLAFG